MASLRKMKPVIVLLMTMSSALAGSCVDMLNGGVPDEPYFGVCLEGTTKYLCPNKCGITSGGNPGDCSDINVCSGANWLPTFRDK